MMLSQVARSGNLEQANQVCNLLVQVKRDLQAACRAVSRGCDVRRKQQLAVLSVIFKAAEGLPKLRA